MCLREKIMSHLIFAILELHITSNHKKITCYASHQQRDIYMLNHELFLGKYYEIVYCLFIKYIYFLVSNIFNIRS